jgi:hypothetical protein
MTPEGVINSADINPQEGQCNAEQVVSQETVVVVLGPAAENVVKRRQAHADLEAHQKSANDEFVLEVRVNLQEGDVVDGEGNEQKEAEYV